MDDWGFTLFMPHYCSDLRIILYMKIYLILLLFWADGKKYIFLGNFLNTAMSAVSIFTWKTTLMFTNIW